MDVHELEEVFHRVHVSTNCLNCINCLRERVEGIFEPSYDGADRANDVVAWVTVARATVRSPHGDDTTIVILNRWEAAPHIRARVDEPCEHFGTQLDSAAQHMEASQYRCCHVSMQCDVHTPCHTLRSCVA